MFPRGTKLGLWLFISLVNNLLVTHVDLWKYIDDSTVSEVVPKDSARVAESIANEVVNPDKCRVSNFVDTEPRPFKLLQVCIPSCYKCKALGLTIGNELMWKPHTYD